MKTKTALVLATALLALPLSAQDRDVQSVERQTSRYPLIPIEELVLERYAPADPDMVYDLHDAVRGFLGRKIMVDNADGSQPSVVENTTIFGSSILFYDTQEQVARLVQSTKMLERISREEEAEEAAREALEEHEAEHASPLRVMEYSPRYTALSTIATAVRPFARSLRLRDDEGVTYQRDNMTVVNERSSLIVRDTEDNLAQIRELVEQIDRPQPQVTFTAMLVRAKDEPQPAALPEELREHLAQLVGYDHYQHVAVSTLRSSVGSGREISMMLGPEDARPAYSIQIRCGAYDEETGSLSIERCKVVRPSSEGTTTLFETACMVTAGEYTVLGSTGQMPLLVVLRIVPEREAAGAR